MPGLRGRTAVPVLLLHNVDPAWEPPDQEEARRLAAEVLAGLEDQGHRVAVVEIADANLRSRLRPYPPREWVVFNACESLPGVDHSEVRVAQELTTLGYAFTGSPPDALARSWDKPLVKRLLARQGVLTPEALLCPPGDAHAWSTFPAIVKPAYEHSSAGVTRDAVVLNPEELRARIGYVMSTFLQPALVEDMIDGREFHVTVWGAEQLRMLPVAEMDFQAFSDVRDRLCTYESKFDPASRAYQGIGLLLPAPLTPSEVIALRKVAVAAYRTVGCRDYARLDIRLREGRFYVLDVNPNPDISSDASVAASAEQAGYSYGAFVSQIVRLAASRHPGFAHALGAVEPRARIGPAPARLSLEPKLHT